MPPGKIGRRCTPDFLRQRLGGKPQLKREGMLAPLARGADQSARKTKQVHDQVVHASPTRGTRERSGLKQWRGVLKRYQPLVDTHPEDHGEPTRRLPTPLFFFLLPLQDRTNPHFCNRCNRYYFRAARSIDTTHRCVLIIITHLRLPCDVTQFS